MPGFFFATPLGFPFGMLSRGAMLRRQPQSWMLSPVAKVGSTRYFIPPIDPQAGTVPTIHASAIPANHLQIRLVVRMTVSAMSANRRHQ